MPDAWCCPVVLCAHLGDQFQTHTVAKLSDSCGKNVVPRAPGSILRLTGYIEVHIPRGAYNRYKTCGLGDDLLLRELVDGAKIMCGGRRWHPLVWQEGNMAPSCGRCATDEEATTDGWERSRKARIWFCPACKALDYTASWLGV